MKRYCTLCKRETEFGKDEDDIYCCLVCGMVPNEKVDKIDTNKNLKEYKKDL